MNFWEGFQKQAFKTGEVPNMVRDYKANIAQKSLKAMPKPTKKTFKDALPTLGGIAAGAGAAYGAYKMLRGKGPKLHQIGVQQKGGQGGQWWKRLAHGADRVVDVGEKQIAPGRAKVLKGVGKKDVVMYTSAEGRQFHKAPKGVKTVGDVSKGGAIKELSDNKASEARLIKKYSPGVQPKTLVMGKTHKGVRNLKATHAKQKGQDYLIKEKGGLASGVGGESFVSSKDVDQFFKNKNLVSEAKRKKITNILKQPNEYILQHKMNIEKGMLTGASRELRVHAVGGKVVPGAASVRGKNIEDVAKTREAERFVQKFLDRLPKKYKGKNITYAPDVAITSKGMQIIELNAGAAESALIDPRYMLEAHGKVKGLFPAMSAVSKSQKHYKAITGRDAPLSAGIKGLAAGGAAGAGTHAAIKE